MQFEDYVEQQDKALRAVSSDVLKNFVEGLKTVRGLGGTMWVAGNGGSSASASHAVADFVKTSTAHGARPFRTISVSELLSLTTAFSNDVSFEESLSSTISSMAEPGDAILLISVSGKSPNLISCAKVAKDKGLTLFSLVGAQGTKLAAESDHSIVIDSEDYQTVENAHMTLIHWFVKELW